MEPRPSDVYLVTDVLVAAAFPGTTLAGASARFCQQLIDAGSRVYFSQVLRLELAQVVQKFATKPEALPTETRADFALDDWASDFLVRHRWMTTAIEQFDAYLAQFADVYEVPLRPRILRAAVGIMALEGLKAHDAAHLATARDLRLGHLATCERDFRNITNPRVWLIRED
jgi:predicted nucleic acid-binding protein